MKRVDSASVVGATTKTQFPLPIGTWKKAALRFTSTLDTGEGANLVASDFGKILLSESFPASRYDFAKLDALQLLKYGGKRNKDIDTDTLDEWWIDVPFYLEGDDDVIKWVERQNSQFLEIEWAASLATRLAANVMSVELYLEEQEGIQPYRVRYNEQQLSVVSGSKPFPLLYENIAALWIENDSTVTQVRLKVDGSIVEDISYDGLIHQTLRNNNLDDDDFDKDTVSLLPFLEIDFRKRKSLIETVNSEVILEVDASGADTIDLGIISVDFTPRELQMTQQALADSTEEILKRAGREGRSRVVDVIKSLI